MGLLLLSVPVLQWVAELRLGGAATPSALQLCTVPYRFAGGHSIFWFIIQIRKLAATKGLAQHHAVS